MAAAEAGADYVMFGEPDDAGERPTFDAIEERVAWWAEVFEAPCVGFAGSAEEVAPLVKAGADFIALGDWVWREPADGRRDHRRRRPADAGAGGRGMMAAWRRNATLALLVMASRRAGPLRRP